jgi:hypothetical protein
VGTCQKREVKGGNGQKYGESTLGGARNGFTVEQHFFHQDFAGVFHTQRDHGETVAYQDHVHACLVGDESTGEVVRGDHGDGLVLAVHGLQRGDGDGLAGRGGRGAHG